MTQSDMAEALAEIHKIDPNFNKETFIKECQFEIIPTILEAYLQGRQDILKDWCHEGVSYEIICVTVFSIRSYGAPLAQRASYLALHNSLCGPDGTVNYDYIVTNSINSGPRCIAKLRTH